MKSLRKMILVFLLSIVRITDPVGEINYIPKLDSSRVHSFLENEGLNVIFFLNDLKEAEYANFAILHFSKFIDFAVSTELEGKKYNCEKFPCIVPYFDGKPVQNIENPPNSPTLFAEWCKNLLNKTKNA